MKTIHRFLVCMMTMLIFMTGKLAAQGISIYGLSNIPSSGIGTFPIVTFVKLDPTNGNVTVLDTINGAFATAAGSSTFDHSGNRYMYWGLDRGNAQRLYTIDATSGAIIRNPVVTLAPPVELEFDLKNAKTYGIQRDGSNPSVHYFVEVDLQNGNIIQIKEIPGVQTILVSTSTFNSNNGTYYIAGAGRNGANPRLYKIEAATGNILAQPPFIQGVSELQYDVINDKLYALYRDTAQALNLVEIDTTNGNLTSVMTIPSMSSTNSAIGVSSTTYDQNTGTYIFFGINGVTSGTDSVHFIRPGSMQQFAVKPRVIFGEYECDNTAFAERFYSNTTSNDIGSLPGPQNPTGLGVTYLNNSEVKLRLPRNVNYDFTSKGKYKSAKVALLDMQGKVLFQETRLVETLEVESISTKHLPVGVYTVALTINNQVLTAKLMKL
ncbi:MAG: T9SS type A sorting domain-containing protein [Bacteroidota bacterium]